MKRGKNEEKGEIRRKREKRRKDGGKKYTGRFFLEYLKISKINHRGARIKGHLL